MEDMKKKKKKRASSEQEQELQDDSSRTREEGSGTEELMKQIEQQQKSIEELEAKNSRLRAEFHNFKNAVTRETREIVSRVEQNLLLKLLGLYEDLERALDHTERIDENFLSGVRMIYKRMFSVLQEEGIEEIKPETGKPFDPFLHEVSETVETNAFDEMAVVEVEEKGYLFNDKVLRPARVIVAVKPGEEEKPESE